MGAIKNLLLPKWAGFQQNPLIKERAKKMIDATVKGKKESKFRKKMAALRGLNSTENKTYLRLQLMRLEEYCGNFRRKQTVAACWVLFMSYELEKRRRWAAEFYSAEGETLELIRLYWLGNSTTKSGEAIVNVGKNTAGIGDGEKEEKGEKENQKQSEGKPKVGEDIIKKIEAKSDGSDSAVDSTPEDIIIGAGAEFGKRAQNVTGGKVLIPKHHKCNREWFELSQGHIQEAFRVGKQERLNRRKLWADRYQKVLTDKKEYIEKLERKKEVRVAEMKMGVSASGSVSSGSSSNTIQTSSGKAEKAATLSSNKIDETTTTSNNVTADRSIDHASTGSAEQKNAANNSESIGTWGRIVNFVLWRTPENSEKMVTDSGAESISNTVPLAAVAQEHASAVVKELEVKQKEEEKQESVQPQPPASESICKGDPDKLLPVLRQQVERLEAELQVEETLLDEIRSVQGPPELHYEDVYPQGYDSVGKLASRVSSGVERVKTWARVFFAIDYSRTFMVNPDSDNSLPVHKRPKYASIKMEVDEVDVGCYFKKVDLKIRAVNEANLKGTQNNLGKMEARIDEIAQKEKDLEKERILREQKIQTDEQISQIMRTNRFQFISRVDRMLGVEWFTKGVYGYSERSFMNGEVVAARAEEAAKLAEAEIREMNATDSADSSKSTVTSPSSTITATSTPTLDTRPAYIYISGNFNSEYLGKQVIGDESEEIYEERGFLFYFNKPYMLKNDIKAWFSKKAGDGDEEVWVAEEGTVVGTLGGSRGEVRKLESNYTDVDIIEYSYLSVYRSITNYQSLQIITPSFPRQNSGAVRGRLRLPGLTRKGIQVLKLLSAIPELISIFGGYL
jgi:hypothetical protein